MKNADVITADKIGLDLFIDCYLINLNIIKINSTIEWRLFYGMSRVLKNLLKKTKGVGVKLYRYTMGDVNTLNVIYYLRAGICVFVE